MIEYSEIEDSIRVEEVLDELGIRETHTTKRGHEHWSNCPLDSHPGADRKPSFSVNDTTLLWHCYTCGEGGPLPLLIAALEHYEDIRDADGEMVLSKWDQAVEWLLPFSDGPASTDEGFLKQIESYLNAPARPPVPSRRARMPFLMERVLEGLLDVPDELLAQWNINRYAADYYGLRYDPERTDRMRMQHTGPAIVIPHRFNGNLVGYQERWIGERPEWLPKYTNTDDFPKATTLWGSDHVGDVDRPVIVVEAALTVARLRSIAYQAVGTFGASVSERQVRILRSFTAGVWIASDDDPDYLNRRGQWVKGAGYKTLQRLLDDLCDYVPVEVIPPVGQEKGDLADIGDDEVHALIEKRRPGFLLRTDT